jgi:hypothetical protein
MLSNLCYCYCSRFRPALPHCELSGGYHYKANRTEVERKQYTPLADGELSPLIHSLV